MNTKRTNKHSQIINFMVLLGISITLCNCVSESDDMPLIGGCKYESDTGYVKFIGYGDTIAEKKQAIFNFYSNKTIRLPFGQFYDTTCLKFVNFKQDTSYKTIRNKLIEGTCAGDFYTIETMQNQCSIQY